jgi:hypothetical protein
MNQGTSIFYYRLNRRVESVRIAAVGLAGGAGAAIAGGDGDGDTIGNGDGIGIGDGDCIYWSKSSPLSISQKSDS